ncbi:MAG: carbohydrate kinase [Clostridiales bacterium]|nr:carbohydrate kinase [Clostridiales bacterium]
MSKIISIGEMLIDFMPVKKVNQGLNAFEQNPGGAPANVSICVSRLGGEAKFIGKLGNDTFGKFLIDVLVQDNVNVEDVILTDEAHTALAFVTLDETGERDFMFYRSPSADMLLHEDEIREQSFNRGDILHFCSVALIESPGKYAHLKAIDHAKNNGTIISFDPNVRLSLWDDENDCRQTILDFIPYAEILKLSDEELFFITQLEGKDAAIQKINELNPNLKWLIITKGQAGVEAYVDNQTYDIPGYKVATIDTTGAGDSFIGAVLYSIANTPDKNPEEILKFANAVGALTTTKLGAIPALPHYDEVVEFMKNN